MPMLDQSVAPCFEAANTFLLVTITDGAVQERVTLACQGKDGFTRVKLMRLHDVDLLICGGIKNHYRDILTACGVQVIAQISCAIEQALGDLLKGRLAVAAEAVEQSELACEMPHCNLLEWAKELFSRNGYKVSAGPGEDAFLVDLVAEMTCPQCHRPVRVAICCGAHAYRCTTEISEFHHTTRFDYHARVYVSPANPTIESYCRDYGIELLDPGRVEPVQQLPDLHRLPILKGVIHDHERLSPL